ncbi:methyltransferase domain-containing protein [Noviherbaspirillum sp. DKR-6]|uniref:Malonyl-[acyl-carrier protein] O-methyltransferase n=1 Tax=Noviherbaspirillum pedocola TaxID=2801341 RepID=A0A934ST35_9BURK|nr:methyltransferase domain-containing protein [Noviherbaspirillum pedocola]
MDAGKRVNCADYLIAPHRFVSQAPSPAERASAPIDLRRVRRLFSDPARVAESGFLRREVAGRMFERLELIRTAPALVLDAGCGEGADLPLLRQRFGEARLLGLDASAAMLGAARASQDAALSSVNRLLRRFLPRAANAPGVNADLVCGDFANLPLAAVSADLIWSNLALHWHPQPHQVFQEWRRVLRVDGLLMFSCFGPDTFRELREAWAGIDGAPHTLPFVDMHDFGDMLVDAGFATPVMDMETITVTYADADRLLADVRAWGGNPLATRSRGLLGRAAHARLRAALDAGRRPDGKLPLTFEIVYGHAFRPVPKTTAAGESIIRFDRPKK